MPCLRAALDPRRKVFRQHSRDRSPGFSASRINCISAGMTEHLDVCAAVFIHSSRSHDARAASMIAGSMQQKPCFYCKKKFQPSRYRPDQRVCSSADCQRRRRNDYHRNKLATDPIYREQCRDSQKDWRARNPSYMRHYRARPATDSARADLDLIGELRLLLESVKNNVALDLKSIDGRAWLVFPSGMALEKNTLASAKIIVLQGIMRILE